jgi:hypothetical protein
MQIITNYSNYFTKLEQYMINFKRKQESEREKLLDTIKYITKNINSSASLPPQAPTSQNSFKHPTNHVDVNNNSSSSHNNSPQQPQSQLLALKQLSSSLLSLKKQGSYNDVYQLHQMQTNKSFGTSKTGFLLKHASRSRVRKHWMRRKCVVENGSFMIFHSDVSLSFCCIVYLC